MTTPYYQDDLVTLHHGDCLDVLRTLPDCSVDAVVTDPPYNLTAGKRGGTGVASVNLNSPYGRARIGTGNGSGGFMGQHWDDYDNHDGGFQGWCQEWASECLRALKPGGHLLAFGGSRTWHRLATGIEDAGFEIRDSIAWLYAQGFPKSMNVGKSPVFCQCEMGEWPYGTGEPEAEHGLRDVPDADVSAAQGTTGGPGSLLLAGVPESGTSAPGREELPGPEVRTGESGVAGRSDDQADARQLQGRPVRSLPGGVPVHGASRRLRDGAPTGHGTVDRPAATPGGSCEPQRPQPGEQRAGEPGAVPQQRGSQARRGGPLCARCGKPPAPAGLGTALKPAFEPVVVARKPLAGTVAANVLAHRTGALNIDACRVGDDGGARRGPDYEPTRGKPNAVLGSGLDLADAAPRVPGLGRWPANVILDETQAEVLDEQSGDLTSGKMQPTHTTANREVFGQNAAGGYTTMETYGDSGGATRFFYVAKAAASERVRVNGVSHPTVKPLELMRWLIRLVTPPGGVVLEPFAGSGTTVEACLLEHMRCLAIEREADYLPLIRQRIDRRRDPVAAIRGAGDDAGLFDLLDKEGA